MAKGRVKKEKRLEICDWVAEKADRLLNQPEGLFGDPAAGGESGKSEDQYVLAAIDEASKEFGYRATTIRSWFEAQSGQQVQARRPRKKKARKASAEADPKASVKELAAPAGSELEEALVAIGELVLAREGVRTTDREVLLATGRIHLARRRKS